MKKLLLMGSALIFAVSAFTQNQRVHPHSKSVLDMKKLRAQLHQVGTNETVARSPLFGSGPNFSQQRASSPSPSTFNWKLLCGSMNVNGMLVSSSRPLQYNAALNAVTFIHRKSTSYQPSPSVPSTAESGVVVAEVSTDWGTTWDSTALWSNVTQWGRYPQGAIYNPAGNTNMNNAYIVGCGPTVSGNDFTGNWYASKQLGSYDNIASTDPGAQQFLSFTLSTYPPDLSQHGWSRNGFSATNDGVVRSLAIIENDLQGLTTMRGFAVVTGTFNGTAFDWRVDSLIPNCIPDLQGEKHLNSDPQMAWNQAGTVGYIVGIGALSTSTLCNKGYQPIVYKLDKTTNAAATWTLMQGIDFNSPALKPLTFKCVGQPVTQPLVNGDTIGIPFVNDYDITVDSNNNLHIGLTYMSSATDHPDSLNFISQFATSINPSELYKWAHVNGSRPYLYDFIGDGIAPWKAVLVDSIASEGPSAAPGFPGYNENPWDGGDDGIKVGMDSRIQLGRTTDGKFISFSWAESDTSYTPNAFKWNNLPDIKARLMSINSGSNMYVVNTGQEVNVSESDNNVRSRATLTYMSPTTGDPEHLYTTAGSTVNLQTPFTVTNSNPYSRTTNNSTWYTTGKMVYAFNIKLSEPGIDITGIAENNSNIKGVSNLFPNPATGHSYLKLTLQNPSLVEVQVINSLGQKVGTSETKGQTGENQLRIDVDGLASGIYFVNVKAGSSFASKKLIIE